MKQSAFQSTMNITLTIYLQTKQAVNLHQYFSVKALICDAILIFDNGKIWPCVYFIWIYLALGNLFLISAIHLVCDFNWLPINPIIILCIIWVIYGGLLYKVSKKFEKSGNIENQKTKKNEKEPKRTEKNRNIQNETKKIKKSQKNQIAPKRTKKNRKEPTRNKTTKKKEGQGFSDILN